MMNPRPGHEGWAGVLRLAGAGPVLCYERVPIGAFKKAGHVDIVPRGAFEGVVGDDLRQELTPLAQDAVSRAWEYVDSVPGLEAVDDSLARRALHQDPHVTKDAPEGRQAGRVAMANRHGFLGQVDYFPAIAPRALEDDYRGLAPGADGGPNWINGQLFGILIDLIHEEPDDPLLGPFEQ
jgi:hypothetical protein